MLTLIRCITCGIAYRTWIYSIQSALLPTHLLPSFRSAVARVMQTSWSHSLIRRCTCSGRMRPLRL